MRAKVDPNESTEAKLKRLANHRVNRAVNTIRLVGNLAGYKPDQAATDRILTALSDAVQEVKVKFTSKGRSNRSEFHL